MHKSFAIKAIGQVLRRGEQEYVCVDIRPVQRKTGAWSRYAVLGSKCADCGADFECTVGMTGSLFKPNRRCEKHRAPGVAPGALNALNLRLQDEKAELARQLAEAKREAAAARKALASAERRLARYELTSGEQTAFAAHCAQMTRERRAHIAKARPKGAGVFD